MKSKLVAALSGALFGIGLGLSGMTLPSKVKGFLDFTGQWDPSLMLVMAGAILVHAPLVWVVLRRKAPLWGDKFGIPTRKDIDFRLVAGAAIFGIGWGLGGYCPGPGLVSMVTGSPSVIAFVVAMAIGMLFHAWTTKPKTQPTAVEPSSSSVAH